MYNSHVHGVFIYYFFFIFFIHWPQRKAVHVPRHPPIEYIINEDYYNYYNYKNVCIWNQRKKVKLKHNTTTLSYILIVYL